MGSVGIMNNYYAKQEAEIEHFPAHIQYEDGVRMLAWLKQMLFIAADTDSASFMYLMGCTNQMPAEVKKIVWTASGSNKQLLRELVEHAYAGLIESKACSKADIEKMVPNVFVNAKGESMTLAKNKQVPSFESDAISDFFHKS